MRRSSVPIDHPCTTAPRRLACRPEQATKVQFNQLVFLLFFGCVLFFHYVPRISWTWRKVALVAFSCAFYGAWDPLFLLLLWSSTIIDWHVAKRLYRTEGLWARRGLLGISLFTNLLPLAYFKYGGFILKNAAGVSHLFGSHWQPGMPDVILPAGISFYTFQTLSYTFDVYRKKGAPARSALDYAVFVTFFPQLVAGPIVRATDFLPQCDTRRQASWASFGWGATLFILGVFEKSVMADGLLAPAVDAVYRAGAGEVSTPDAWVGTLAFAGQIFCDFAGYSTSAIGAALCLGFSLPSNFRFPYASLGFSDFWKRWHISLSTWLRDYLYVSLGGNRAGAVRTYVNLMTTMLLGGLWHGASWNFVVWGGLHGTYLIAERWLRKVVPAARIWKLPITEFLLTMLTLVLVCFTWVFFRATTFHQAFSIISAMLGHAPAKASALLTGPGRVVALVPFAGLVSAHWLMRKSSLESVAARTPAALRVGILALLLILIICMPGEDRAFIYFQF